MKTIHLTCQHAISGIGRYGLELTKALRAKNPELTWYKPYRADHPDAELHERYDWIKGFAYRSFRSAHPYVIPFYLKHALNNEPDPVLHAHWFLSGLSAVMQAPKRTVVTMHDLSLLHIQEADRLYTGWYRRILRTFSRNRVPIIVVSDQAKADAITYGNYPEELIHRVYNGIDHNQFYPLERKAKGRMRIIYCGGLGKRKNLGLLLRAFRQLEQRFGDEIELVIAGAHPERTPWPELAKALAIRNVMFTGFLPDDQMNGFYNSGDLMIYPSEYEGFGFAPLEAMAAGTPVLSSKGGSLSEVSGGGAELFDYDTDDLVTKATRLLENPSDRKSLREKGLQWSRRYTWQQTAAATRRVYATLLAGSNQSINPAIC